LLNAVVNVDLTLLIYLSLDLTTSGRSKMLNMITTKKSKIDF